MEFPIMNNAAISSLLYGRELSMTRSSMSIDRSNPMSASCGTRCPLSCVKRTSPDIHSLRFNRNALACGSSFTTLAASS